MTRKIVLGYPFYSVSFINKFIFLKNYERGIQSKGEFSIFDVQITVKKMLQFYARLMGFKRALKPLRNLVLTRLTAFHYWSRMAFFSSLSLKDSFTQIYLLKIWFWYCETDNIYVAFRA